MGKFFTKRVVPVVLIISMLLSMTVTSFAAETTEPTVSMTASEIVDGKFTVTVSVANNPGIDSFNWKLGYDSALVTPVYDADTFWGDVVSGGTLETNLADPEYVAGTAISTVFAKADGTTANGKVFAVDFALTAQAYNADINFTLDIDDTVTTGTFADVAGLTVKGPLAAVTFKSIEVTSVDSTEATISWDIVATEAEHDVFVVLRDGVEVATLTTEDRSYTDTGLTVGTSYVYQVKCGEVLSAEVTAKTVAKAEKASTITLIPGGTNKSETITWEYTTYVLPEGTDYTREGYTFAGWTADNGATILSAGSEYAVEGNVVLQAVWTKAAATPTTWVNLIPGTEVNTISYNYSQGERLGRNNGGYFFAQFPAIADTDFIKAAFQFYGLQKAGYCYLNLYPVTEANFTAAFGDYLIADNLNAVGIEVPLDVFPTLETSIYKSSQLTTTDSNAWLPAHDITSFVKENANGFILASKLTGGNSTTDGLRMAGTKARILTYHLPEEEDTTGRAVVTFDANGGTGSITRIVADPGEEITLPSEGFTLQANELAGWTNGKTTYALGAKVTVEADTVFKAVWEYQGGEVTLEPVATYYVKVPSTGDATVTKTTGQVHMASGTADDPAGNFYLYNVYDLTGYRNVKSAVINKTVNKITRSSTTRFAPVTSVWPETLTDAELADITVGSNIASGTLSQTNNKVDGAYVPFTDTFDITEYVAAYEGDTLVIREWATNWDYGQASASGSADTYSPKAADTITLVTGTEYMVSFDANGGEGKLPETVFGTLTLPECELTNGDLAFAGWSDGSKVYAAGVEYTPKKDTVLKATWGNAVTITLDDNGTITKETVGVGGEILLPEGSAVATIGTLTFVGWEYAGTVYTAGTKVKADISKTYTAVYDYVGATGNIAWVESWYFANPQANKVVTDTVNGTLTKNPTGQKNLFRQTGTSAYFAKIDLRGIKNVKTAALNVNHTKFNTAVTAAVYDVSEADYNAAFANAATGAFLTADLPAGTLVTSQKFSSGTTPNPAVIDITEYIAGKVAAGADYAYIKLANTAGGSATTDGWRVSGFSTASYVTVTTSTIVDVAFDMGADAITAEVGETITLPECTAVNGTLDFAGWSDGTTTYEAGAEYVVNGDVTFTAVWAEVAKVMYTYNGELLSSVYPAAGEVITLPASDAFDFGAFKFAGWSDGTTTYEAGAEYTFVGDAVVVFDAVVTFDGGGEATVEFDAKNLLTLGKYDETAAAYDNTVKSVATTSGTAVSVNTRMTKGSEGYRVRPFVVVSADLSQALLAESVILNLSVNCSGSATNSIIVRALDSMPAVGDAHIISDGEKIGDSITFTASTAGAKTLDITEAYNEAVGSTLYIKIYGWAYDNGKAQNYVTLDVDSVNMTVTVPSGTPVMFDQGAQSRTAEAGTTITLPEFTGTAPEGKAFTGWSDGTTTYAAGADFVVPATSVTLTAQFADGVTLTVVGENNETKEFSYIAGEITLPDAEFTKSGYTFAGYVKAGSPVIYKVGAKFTLEEDTVLTAVFYKHINYTAWYNQNYDKTNAVPTTVSNYLQSVIYLGRNSGTHAYTTIDISGLDYEVFGVSAYFSYKMQKTGSCKMVAYPVTGDYATTFAGIEYGTTSAETVDVSGLTLGDWIGCSNAAGPSGSSANIGGYLSAETAYAAGEIRLYGMQDYLNDQFEAGNTSINVAYGLVGGNKTNDGLRYYVSTSRPVYLRVYVLAGAAALEAPEVPDVPVEPTATVDTFTATAASEAQVDLAWTATVENAESYEYVIYRNNEAIATVTDLSYVDTAVEAETTYAYKVAVKVGEEEIAYSEEVEVTTPAAPVLEPNVSVDTVTVSNVTYESATVSWTSTVENAEVTYTVSVNGEVVAEGLEVLTYALTDLDAETAYTVEVKAVYGEEYAANTAEFTTAKAPVVVDGTSPKVVLCEDGYYRYYPNGTDADPATGFWMLDGYLYQFSTSASKYGAAQVNTTLKLKGDNYTFNQYGVVTAVDDASVKYVFEPEVEVVDLTSSVTSTSATISWNVNVTNAVVTGYKIYRDGVEIATVEANVDGTAIAGVYKKNAAGVEMYIYDPVTGTASYTDNDVFQNTNYVYKVEAIYEDGTASNEFSVLTDAYASRYVTYNPETGYWYYIVDGVNQTGWHTTPDGYRYYFSSSSKKYGAAMVGTNQRVGQGYYDFTDYGALISSYDETTGDPILFYELNGWYTDEEGVTRYYDANVYRIGWQYIDGYKYYFSMATGKLLTGYTKVGSVNYLLDETDGHWINYYQTQYTVDESPASTSTVLGEDGYYRYYPNGTEEQPLTGWKVLPGEDAYYKYYFSSASSRYGAAMTGYAVIVGSQECSFYPTGALMLIDVADDGSAYMHPYSLSLEQGAKNGLLLEEDGEYRYFIDGEFQTGWLEIDGSRYLFKRADGSAVTSADHNETYGGYKYGRYVYVFDAEGRLQSQFLYQ